MTSVAVPPEVINKTRSELGKFVKKPPLTDKLLNKPPFRFLHDIIKFIIAETGFLDGLFTDLELSSDSVKDKDSKVAFLQKCIDATSLAIGEQVNVRPSKVVAGHEADKTNEWLQALAAAIENKVDTREAVSQVLSGVKPGKPKKDKEKDKEKDKDKEKEREHKKSEKKEREKKEARSKDPKDKERSSRKEKEKDKDKDKDRDKSSRREKDKDKSEDGEKKERRSKDKERRSKDKDGEDKEKRRSKTETSEGSPEKSRSSKSGSRSRSSRSKDSGKENSPPQEQNDDNTIQEDQDSESTAPPRPKSTRPPSARPVVDNVGVEEISVGASEGNDGSLEIVGEPDEIVGKPDDGNSSSLLHDQNDLTTLEDQVGVDAPLEDVGIGSGGPTSLGSLDNGQITTEQSAIDPAIVKAMAPDQIGRVLDDPNGSDSGVGSLDSPKETHVLQAAPLGGDLPQGLPSSAEKVSSQPGPQPMRAMGQFGAEGEASEPVVPPFAQQPPQSEASEQRPTTGRGVRPRTALRSARPPSARPAPPRVRERREIPQEEQQRPATSKPVANVIIAGSQDLDDDDAFTVEETKPVLEDDPVIIEPSAGGADGGNAAALAAAAAGEEGAGLLVAQIMETKKELEDGRRAAFSPETPGHRRVPIEQSMLSDASRRKERQIIQKDVQQLSNSIQNITRSVNPLAKQLDYLQEDLDSMQKELENWRNENKQLGLTLKREQGLTDAALDPMKASLLDLDSAVLDQRDKVSTLKSNILTNRDKINKLMQGINMNL